MNVSPANVSIATAGLAAQAADAERAAVDAIARRRELSSAQKTQAAAGVAELDGAEHEPGGQGNAGRPPLERPTSEAATPAPPPPPPPPPDPRRRTGTLLDITG